MSVLEHDLLSLLPAHHSTRRIATDGDDVADKSDKDDLVTS